MSKPVWRIAPSILSADFANLECEIASVSAADYLHFDVMDGVFVPNISVGFPVLQAVRKVTELPLDVHLMITEPSRYAARFVEAGADIVTFHVEADEPDGILRAILEVHDRGRRVGLALKPATGADALLPYLELLDIVTVMTVEPGFGGQKFMAEQMPKLRRISELLAARNPTCELEVDGGINPETLKICAANGANVFVAGNDVFRAENRAARIAELRLEAGEVAL
ncbi:MAG: ribulose-phosphate 3-epimerase [Oscillospiraceae bacterium]|jgi:ribulose-phosphate 3-epimerase|nr:ribulose-phosphate 3-epimerase [Oscillospiraceae bacterium]